MKLHKVRGGTRKEFFNGEYNVAIGVSLGTKWFSVENVTTLAKWILPFTKEFLVIYVADTLHVINIEVRNKRSRESAERKAREIGEQFVETIQVRLGEELSASENEKVFYKRWDDLMTENYKERLDYLYSKYDGDESFRNTILDIVRNFTASESKNFSEEEIYKLGTYVIEELPEMLTRVPMDGFVYDANAYPFDSKIPKLAEDIQLGNIFPEIAEEVIDAGNKVFLEVR